MPSYLTTEFELSLVTIFSYLRCLFCPTDSESSHWIFVLRSYKRYWQSQCDHSHLWHHQRSHTSTIQTQAELYPCRRDTQHQVHLQYRWCRHLTSKCSLVHNWAVCFGPLGAHCGVIGCPPSQPSSWSCTNGHCHLPWPAQRHIHSGYHWCQRDGIGPRRYCNLDSLGRMRSGHWYWQHPRARWRGTCRRRPRNKRRSSSQIGNEHKTHRSGALCESKTTGLQDHPVHRTSEWSTPVSDSGAWQIARALDPVAAAFPADVGSWSNHPFPQEGSRKECHSTASSCRKNTPASRPSSAPRPWPYRYASSCWSLAVSIAAGQDPRHACPSPLSCERPMDRSRRCE